VHWEAFFVVGGLTFVLGALLLVPSLLWARKARANPTALGAKKVARADLLMTFTIVGLLVAALTARLWAEGTWFGRWVSTDGGSLTFLAAAFAGLLMAQLLLRLVVLWLRRTSR
jgi:hypothetical protein